MKYKTKADVERVIAANKPSTVIEKFTQSYLEGLAIVPLLLAEAHYLELLAQEDVPDVEEVTEDRSVLVTPTQYVPIEGTDEYEVTAEAVYEMQPFVISGAFSANTERDDEIASLVLDYPHLVEPEPIMESYTAFDEGGEEVTLERQLPIPTMQERRPDLIVDVGAWKKQNYALFRCSQYPPIEDYLDAVVKGDEEARQSYIDKCKQVKADNPKED